MAKESAPFEEGSGWAMRRRVCGQDLYVSGHKTKTKAKKAMDKLVTPLQELGKPKGEGPFKTSLAEALQSMALERLPFLKSAEQEARRINGYLRAAGLKTLKLKPTSAMRSTHGEEAERTSSGSQYFVVELEDSPPERRVPQGLGPHRQAQAEQTREAEALRKRLAHTKVADVQAHQVQKFLLELAKVRSPATLQLERAVLRGFFNYARDIWRWSEPKSNPCVRLRLPKVENGRTRVMSVEEQQRLDAAIQSCRNELVGPTMTLLAETAMRTSEPLEYACWADVDWEHRVIRLRDSKTDQREVPLSPKAIKALKELARLNPPRPGERIVRMSYNALAAAWRRACERAGVQDLHLHDLRHTAATRMALKTGNVFLVKALTGHKTMAQLERYVNVKASDVVAVMHEEQEAKPPPQSVLPEVLAPNVIRGHFKQWRCA